MTTRAAEKIVSQWHHPTPTGNFKSYLGKFISFHGRTTKAAAGSRAHTQLSSISTQSRRTNELLFHPQASWLLEHTKIFQIHDIVQNRTYNIEIALLHSLGRARRRRIGWRKMEKKAARKIFILKINSNSSSSSVRLLHKT